MALRLCYPLRYPHSLSSIPCKTTTTRRFSLRSSSVNEFDSRKVPLFPSVWLRRKMEKLLNIRVGFRVLVSLFLEKSIAKFALSQSMKLVNLLWSVEFGNSFQLVLEVKEKLEKDHYDLPVGSNGRDDEDMILWFLKDRRFSVEEAISKLTKAIKWRQEFGVSELTEDSMKSMAETGKSFVHDFLDVYDRPVLVVVASKHLPSVHDRAENERLCVFLIEKALSKLPEGKQEILGILDLRGFGTENADLQFLTFLFDVFYYYYPKRLGQVLFVEAPFVFRPIWELVKPLVKHYASLVRFCSADTVRKEYFKKETLPPNFRD